MPHHPERAGSSGLRREALVGAALAAFVTVLVIHWGPAGPDLSAHLFQRSFLVRNGFSLWNNLWYAGQYEFVTYSLIYYPLAAVLGVEPLAVLSVAVAAGAFTLVVGSHWGRAARWSSASFAVVWPGVVVTGALPFALGMAMALAACAVLARRAHRWFAVLAILTLAASPLAFLFLALPLAGLLVVHRAEWRRFVRPAQVVVLAVVGELVLWRLFPSTGLYPFWGQDFVGVCVFAGLGALLSWRVEGLRTVRWLFVLYGVACVAAFVIPSEIGANIARIRLAAIPIVLLIVAVRRWRPLPLCLAAVALGSWWNFGMLQTAYGRSTSDPSSEASYWQPAISWLDGHFSADYRVEAVDTSAHWPAVYLPEAGIPLARGWFRQADFPGNQLLYHPLAAPEYLAWLRSLGVGYVVLSDAPPDFSAQGEAALLRSGRSGLQPVARAGAVTIYAVPDPQSMVTGPGRPQVVQLTPGGLVLHLDRPGTYRVAVRWSPYWRPSQGCVAPGPDGMTTLATAQAGTVDVDFHVSPGEALRVLAGVTDAPCPAP